MNSTLRVLGILLLGAALLLSAACKPRTAADYGKRGLARQARGDLDGAIADFDSAIELDPKSPDAYNNRGDARRARGDQNGAIVDYSRAIALDPKFAAAYNNRAIAEKAAGDTRSALADFNRAIALDPKLATGAAKNDSGNNSVAGPVIDANLQPGFNSGTAPGQPGIDAGLDSGVNAAAVYCNSGFAKAAKGDLDGAIADYTRAIELDPSYARAYNNRGIVEAAMGVLDAAIADYNHAIVLDPSYAKAFNNRGIAEAARGNPDAAIADYTRAISLEPTDALVFLNRGSVKQSGGDLDGAIADYTRAIELNSKYTYAYCSRGSARQTKGDLDGALADYNRAIELKPEFAPPYYNRGLVKATMRNWPDALVDCRRFCELSPGDQDFPQLFIWLIRTRQGDTDAAGRELSAYLDKRLQVDKEPAPGSIPADPSGASNGGNTKEAKPGDWISKLGGHLLGTVTEAGLLAAAASPDAKKDSDQHCEAWYFIGAKKLLEGDKAAAIDYFHKCLATGKKDFIEYQMSQSDLKALGE